MKDVKILEDFLCSKSTFMYYEKEDFHKIGE